MIARSTEFNCQPAEGGTAWPSTFVPVTRHAIRKKPKERVGQGWVGGGKGGGGDYQYLFQTLQAGACRFMKYTHHASVEKTSRRKGRLEALSVPIYNSFSASTEAHILPYPPQYPSLLIQLYIPSRL